MAVLEGEGGLLVGEAELLRRRPDLDDVRRGRTGLDQGDRPVDILPCARVGVALRRAGRADGERAVVAGAVPVEAVQDVEERRVPRADEPVGEHMRVRGAPFARDRVDAFDVLGAEVVEGLGDQSDASFSRTPGRRNR